MRSAIGVAMFANVHRNSALRPEPFTWRDFMPYLPIDAEERSRAVADRLRVALPAGGLTGADFKRWQKAQRKRVGTARK